MARRILSARDQVEMLSPWRVAADAPPVIHDLMPGVFSDGNGRWDYRHEGSSGDSYVRHEFGIHPTVSPASHTFTDEWGTPHTIHYDPALTGGQVPKPGRFGHEWDNPQALRNEITNLAPPPNMLWRGVSQEEYDLAKERGYFESRGDYNVGGDSQKGYTFFSTDPGQAGNYATWFAPQDFKPTFTHPGHVVGIPDRPELPRGAMPEKPDPRSTEVGVPGRVPFSAITHHYVGRPSVIRSGSQGVVEGWNGWERSGGTQPSSDIVWQDHSPGNHTARHAARRDPHHGEGPWFHGTNADLTPGSILMPGDTVGKAHGKFSDGTRVWVSNDPVRASAYGSRLYEVSPHTRPRSPYAHHDEHHTTGADVIREISPEDIRNWRNTYDPSKGWHTASTEDYRGQHQGPDPEYGASLHNVEMMFPDYYQHPEYYRTYQPYDHQSESKILKYQGRPDARVDIYRALPLSAATTGFGKNMAFPLNRGDWVTTSYDYAKEHGESNLDQREPWTILHTKAPASQLFTEGNSIHEWAYQGDDKLALEHPTARSQRYRRTRRSRTAAPRTRFTRDWQLIGDDYIPLDVISGYTQRKDTGFGDEKRDQYERIGRPPLSEQVREHGYEKPVELCTDGRSGSIYDGHHRIDVARALGHSHVPVRVTWRRPNPDGTPIKTP